MDVITIFPEIFDVLDSGLIGKAIKNKNPELNVYNLRDWTTDVHQSVDDKIVGGGAGMLLRADIAGKAIDDIQDKNKKKNLIIPTPSGKLFIQETADLFAKKIKAGEQIIFLCSRYQGVDSRVESFYETQNDFEVYPLSVGDYVVNGAEIPTLLMLEAIIRLLPAVLGNPESLDNESHNDKTLLLEAPNYTLPRDFKGMENPEILYTGHHENIKKYRKEEAVKRTIKMRPDLIEKISEKMKRDREFKDNFSKDQLALIEEFLSKNS